MNFDRLRALLFQQAMRGQLVPQFDEEKSVNIMPIVTSDVPHELPRKWVWVRSDEILEFIRGVTFPASAKRSALSEGIVRCLTTGSVQKRHNLAADVFVPSTYVKKDRQYLKKNDVVISSANSKELVGKSIIWKGGEPRVSFGGFLTVARVKKDEINSIFVYYFFQFLFESRYFANLSTQTTNIANLSNALLSSVLFPLPPIEEQERIVAKLEEAFAEIDRAEKAYEELQTLAGVLRGQILQEAIQGKLVPQLVSDGVTKQIAEAPEEVPFDIPNTWSWIRGEELAVKRKTIDPSTLTNDEIELWSIPAYDAGVAEKVSPGDIGSSKKVVQAGDVLLAKIVPHIERVWIVSESANSLMKLASTEWLVYASELFLPEFMGLLFRSPYFRTKMMESVSGMGSLKRANPRTLAKVWLPVPPIKEQERIVIKVETLLKQVNLLLTK